VTIAQISAQQGPALFEVAIRTFRLRRNNPLINKRFVSCAFLMFSSCSPERNLPI